MKKKEENKHFLGVDWGESKCGLALADSENKLALGLKEVQQKELINEIKNIGKEFFIKRIILGEVSNKLFDQDILALENLKIEISLENEKFSTLLAQKNLAETNKKKISKNDNVESARIILQTWLDR
jgi:RNase H-fold protein (predicted Holliday junction resolvase)